MLVIRRRAGESFRIGDEIEIEILESSGGQVKIGIRAPREVPVLRNEVFLTNQQNRSAAAAGASVVEALVKGFSPGAACATPTTAKSLSQNSSSHSD
jgi:carbon storage regulator